MLAPEEANKLRAEVNRLRVNNTILEEELSELKHKNDVASAEPHNASFVANIGIKTASQEDKDDLKQISGVGPFIEEKLNRLGIYSFEQIASMTQEQAEKINEAIEFFPGRIQRDDWVGQAKRLGE